MIRMPVVGYVFAIRSERLICREVQVNLAYRWFCKLGIEDAVQDHSAFGVLARRNERFRDGDVKGRANLACARLQQSGGFGYRDYSPVGLGACHGEASFQGMVEIAIKAQLVPFAQRPRRLELRSQDL
jgi:hypothetical protein